jgi:hypothetical protein
MSRIRAVALGSILAGFSFLSGCGSGSAGDLSSSGLGYIPGYGFENSGFDCTGGGKTNVTPGGSWGTSGLGGFAVQFEGYVDESGAFRFRRLIDGIQYVGTLTFYGNVVSNVPTLKGATRLSC